MNLVLLATLVHDFASTAGLSGPYRVTLKYCAMEKFCEAQCECKTDPLRNVFETNSESRQVFLVELERCIVTIESDSGMSDLNPTRT